LSTKAKSWLSILLVFIVLIASFLTIFPVKVSISPFKIKLPKTSTTKLGLDLRGGVYVVLAAVSTKNNPVTEQSMDQAMLVIRDRVDRLGVAEPQIERQGKNNILVQLPGVKNPAQTIKLLKQLAVLEFVEVTGEDKKKAEVKLGKTLLTGSALKNARASFTAQGAPQVEMTFNAEGAKKFEEITTRLSKFPERDPKKRLAIVLDKKMITAPNVQGAITGGNAEITGLKSVDEAKRIALVLQSGALPVTLDIQQNRTVGATLGKDSLNAGLRAGIIGLILVALYLLFFYRVYAVLGWISLSIFGIILWGSLVAVGATLTLPGIAGAILMVGIAADSSIIIFERIKDEVKHGRPMRTAIETGFTHGFQTFLDADLVSLVTATILFYFGAGTVKGFALTLMLGIFCDLFVAYFFKRAALNLLARMPIMRKPWLIGVKEAGS
jgi:preprotein translocase subunit SecD